MLRVGKTAVTFKTTAVTPLIGTPAMPVTWTLVLPPAPTGPVLVRVSSTRTGLGDNNTVDQYGDDAQLRRFHDAKPEAGARWQTGSGPCNAPGTCAFTYVNSANGGYSYDATLRRGGAQNHIQITIIKDLGGGA